MGKVETFEGVEARRLPKEWRERLGLDDDAIVRVQVTEQPHRPVDKDRLRRLIAEFQALPILDDRPADEILGYNEQGHFD